MKQDKYYYLRKISKTSDRALYKHAWYSRFYRQDYPIPSCSSVRLYKAKRLSTILRQREALHKYCGEWFDVYDQDDNLVDISEAQNGSICN